MVLPKNLQKMETLTQKKFKLSDWLTCYDELIKFGFTAEEIETALSQTSLNINSLTDINSFEREPTYLKVYEITNPKTAIRVKRYKGQWEREETVMGMDVRVKGNYQNLKHPELIRQLLLNKFEWFECEDFVKNATETIKKNISDLPLSEVPEEYKNCTVAELRWKFIERHETVKKPKWAIFGISGGDHFELYLETEFGTLYVPIAAIMKGNYKAIEKRMIEYWNWYYNKPEKADLLAKSLKPLQSKEALKLSQLLIN